MRTFLLLLVLVLVSIQTVTTTETPDHEHLERARRKRKKKSGETRPKHVQQEREPRIVGGLKVKPDEYPYFVRIDNLSTGSRGICGGTLVAPDVVLTAGHCLKPSLRVVVNGYSRSKKKQRRQRARQVESSARHPGYNGTTWENDFVLLKLKTKVDLPPIPLNFNASVPQTGDDLIAVGMGRKSETGNLSYALRDVTIPAADTKACQDAYQTIERKVIPRIMLCAGDVDKSPCKGDSGGPLLSTGRNKTLVGIISWGAGCGRKSYPTVCARISGVQEWLTKHLCKMSEFPQPWCPKTVAAASVDPTDVPAPTPLNRERTSSPTTFQAAPPVTPPPTLKASSTTATPPPTPKAASNPPTPAAVAKGSPPPTPKASSKATPPPTPLKPTVKPTRAPALTPSSRAPTEAPVTKVPTPNVVP